MSPSKRTYPTAASRRVHSVSAQLSVVELTRAGTALTLEIHGAEGKLGEMEIGRGAIYWTGRNESEPKRISWTRFAEMMDDVSATSLRSLNRRSSGAKASTSSKAATASKGTKAATASKGTKGTKGTTTTRTTRASKSSR